MLSFIFCLFLGLIVGAISGFVGIGGGVLIVPALIFFFGFSQHQAQGTTLALMIPPIGLLAAMTYYKQGYVNLPAALFICLGFFIGGFLGAKLAIGFSDGTLQKAFGFSLFLLSLYFIFNK